MKIRRFRRSKAKFKTAAAAWRDIKRAGTGGDYRGIKGKHTKKFWIFEVI